MDLSGKKDANDRNDNASEAHLNPATYYCWQEIDAM